MKLLNNKIIKKIIIFTLLLVGISAQAKLLSETDIRIARASIIGTGNINETINEIESSIANQNYANADKLAQKLLADTRFKVGVDPRINFMYPFSAANILKTNYPIPYKNLPDNYREGIVNYLKELYSGYYPDLLNLYKRARALLVQARANLIITKNGSLRESEKNAMAKDLAKLVSIPIKFKDSASGYTYIIFDNEFYHNSYNELFQFELFDVSEKLLGVSVQTFNTYVKEYTDSVWKKFEDDNFIQRNTNNTLTLSYPTCLRYVEDSSNYWRIGATITSTNTKRWICRMGNEEMLKCVRQLIGEIDMRSPETQGQILDYCIHTLLED